MCAIAGVVDLRMSEGIIDAMLDTMRRRGPDAMGSAPVGRCTLLHSRLTIIDPEGGQQPMLLEWAGEAYTLVYNGELYNTEEVRNMLLSAGHSFHGHSDTEVVLHAFAQWGEEALQKLNGIFGIAVWEHRKQRLFLARDRMGVKPLFYKLHGNGILFASEIKTILAYPDVHAELDAQGAAQIILLGPGRIPGSGVLKGICELEPGCCCWFDGGKLSVKRYWRLRDREHSENFEETAECVRYLVTDAIQRQMVSDMPLGTFLSGGLDSSLISAVCAAEAKRTGKRLMTFSVDYVNNERYFTPEKFQASSDNYYIGVMQQVLDTEHRWTVLGSDELVAALEEAVIARDLPGMADVDVSLLLFCRQIRQHVKVGLSGECADEIFGGYPWYRDPQVRDREGFPWAQNTKQRIQLLSPDMRKQLDAEGFVEDLYRTTLAESDILPGTSVTERRMKEMVNLNMRWFMQTLLDRKDRMSMYSGLEVRVPFCDYRIAEYMYSVPWEYKDYNGKEKGLLRYAMADLLPPEVLNRKKSPYPKTYDPKYMQMLSERFTLLLQEEDAPIFQIVDKKAMEHLLTANYTWPWYGQLMRVPQTICYMLQVDFWLRNGKISIT